MGMLYGIIGMTALIVGYWVDSAYTYGAGYWLIAVSMAPGLVFGVWSGLAVEVTGLPELVGAYNGFGGLAAALEAIGLYLDPDAAYLVRNGDRRAPLTTPMLWIQAVALCLSIIIGAMTFTGSFVACLKLHGNIASRARVIPCRLAVTVLIFLAMIALSVVAFSGDQTWNDRTVGLACIVLVAALSSAYGIIFVMAIGGGDMPVSISFLNSLSGFSTTATGFMLGNKALVVSGSFVGCSGIILTIVMCNAMNRSMANVLIGNFGEGTSGSMKVAKKAVGTARQATAEDVVEALTSARSIICVPGYGMAVAKAQHSIAELTVRLRARGIKFRFAIHPVAGRLPGHMNVS
jgi:NAD/NADP transhydrogenase beta subunit